MFTGEKSNCM